MKRLIHFFRQYRIWPNHYTNRYFIQYKYPWSNNWYILDCNAEYSEFIDAIYEIKRLYEF